MKELILKIKRTIRFFFYRNLNINEQLDISKHLVDKNLLFLYWKMSKADRQHSYEVFIRTKKNSEDEDLLTLSLLHDIGKSKIDAGVLFRVLSDLGIIRNKKSRIYIGHESIGIEILKEHNIDKDFINYYNNNLLKQKNFILDKTDY
tara:strand:- start:5057 stop:5497 length:441 start_codon:yes stop_codon:yes gene_type:complete